MGNKFGKAYGLTVLIPVKHGTENNRAYDKIIRDQLQKWPLDKQSPMASVPNTYLARVFLLNENQLIEIDSHQSLLDSNTDYREMIADQNHQI